MAATTSTPLMKPQVELIPWDPTSPEHVERLVQQRITCGWDSEYVEGWRERQEKGTLNMQWIILTPTSPATPPLLHKHNTTYPLESSPLVDTATFFGGKARTIPSPQISFVPIGHICLGPPSPEYIEAGYASKEEGLYWIGIFYVSRALQGQGLGRAAMDMVEGIAMNEPLCARALALNAINKVDPQMVEKYAALGLVIPPFSNQEWYERRGYVIYKVVEKLFKKVDKNGKDWFWDAVFLRKELV